MCIKTLLPQQFHSWVGMAPPILRWPTTLTDESVRKRYEHHEVLSPQLVLVLLYFSIFALDCILQMWHYDGKYFFFVLFVWDQSFFTSGIKKHDGSEVLMVIPKVTAVQAVNNKQYSVLYRVLTTSGRGSFHIIFLCKCMLMCEVPALKIKLNYEN